MEKPILITFWTKLLGKEYIRKYHFNTLLKVKKLVYNVGTSSINKIQLNIFSYKSCFSNTLEEFRFLTSMNFLDVSFFVGQSWKSLSTKFTTVFHFFGHNFFIFITFYTFVVFCPSWTVLMWALRFPKYPNSFPHVWHLWSFCTSWTV